MTSTNQTSTEYTLRLLNGMLSTVEFSLTAARTQFCVGDAPMHDGSETGHEAQPADSGMLYIPAETPGPNFAIVLPLENSRGDFQVLLSEQPVRTLDGQFQLPCVAGQVVFAIKPAADAWSDAVLHYQPDISPAAGSQAVNPGRIRRVGKSLLVLLALSVFAVAAWQGWGYLDTSANNRHRLSLDAMLQAPNHHFTIRQGRDQVFYVLAQNEMDAAWAQQRLARGGFDHPVRVLSLPGEQARIDRWLEERHVNYFILRMPSLEHPTLVLSLERNARDADSIRALQQAALALMPYAAKLDLLWQSDAILISDAESRLNKLALTYTRQGDVEHGLVYVLKGEVDDGVLSQLRQQITEFEQSYGERYVRFVLEQREDWLKGKSYKYGADAYVQLGPRHWYFPKPL